MCGAAWELVIVVLCSTHANHGRNGSDTQPSRLIWNTFFGGGWCLVGEIPPVMTKHSRAKCMTHWCSSGVRGGGCGKQLRLALVAKVCKHALVKDKFGFV